MERSKVSSSTRRPRAALFAVAIGIGLTCAAAPGARAAEPGVVYEPGSPSYKEYSIPLEEARRDAGGGIHGSIDSRAFGIGLTRRARGDHGAKGGNSAAKGSRRGARKAQPPATPRSGKGEDSRTLSRRLAEAEGAGAPALWTLLPLLLVLLPGLLVGVILARRGWRHPAT